MQNDAPTLHAQGNMKRWNREQPQSTVEWVKQQLGLNPGTPKP